MSDIHPLADVKTNNIGENTVVWQYAVILEGARIGDHCNINCHTFIENKVIIGSQVTLKSGVYLWDGITVGDKVFIGPNVTFTNDRYPRSQQHSRLFEQTRLEEGCSIGAASTILGGLTIGRFAIIGAGTLVTKDVPAFALFYGNPGKVHHWVNEKGIKLKETGSAQFGDDDGHTWVLENNELIKK